MRGRVEYIGQKLRRSHRRCGQDSIRVKAISWILRSDPGQRRISRFQYLVHWNSRRWWRSRSRNDGRGRRWCGRSCRDEHRAASERRPWLVKLRYPRRQGRGRQIVAVYLTFHRGDRWWNGVCPNHDHLLTTPPQEIAFNPIGFHARHPLWETSAVRTGVTFSRIRRGRWRVSQREQTEASIRVRRVRWKYRDRRRCLGFGGWCGRNTRLRDRRGLRPPYCRQRGHRTLRYQRGDGSKSGKRLRCWRPDHLCRRTASRIGAERDERQNLRLVVDRPGLKAREKAEAEQRLCGIRGHHTRDDIGQHLVADLQTVQLELVAPDFGAIGNTKIHLANIVGFCQRSRPKQGQISIPRQRDVRRAAIDDKIDRHDIINLGRNPEIAIPFFHRHLEGSGGGCNRRRARLCLFFFRLFLLVQSPEFALIVPRRHTPPQIVPLLMIGITENLSIELVRADTTQPRP